MTLQTEPGKLINYIVRFFVISKYNRPLCSLNILTTMQNEEVIFNIQANRMKGKRNAFYRYQEVLNL